MPFFLSLLFIQVCVLVQTIFTFRTIKTGDHGRVSLYFETRLAVCMFVQHAQETLNQIPRSRTFVGLETPRHFVYDRNRVEYVRFVAASSNYLAFSMACGILFGTCWTGSWSRLVKIFIFWDSHLILFSRAQASIECGEEFLFNCWRANW